MSFQPLIDPPAQPDPQPAAPAPKNPIPAELRLIFNVVLTVIAGWLLVHLVGNSELSLHDVMLAITLGVAFARNAMKVVENWEEI